MTDHFVRPDVRQLLEFLDNLPGPKSHEVGPEGARQMMIAGRYALEFQIEGAAFYHFDFSVAMLPSDDPYQPPGTRYFIDGPWSEYGNIFYQRNDPESTLRFTTWVQDKAGHEAKRSVPYEAQLLRQRDGKLLGQDKGELNLTTHWAQADLYFQPAGGDANARLKAAEGLHEDGAYRVRFWAGVMLTGTVLPMIILIAGAVVDSMLLTGLAALLALAGLWLWEDLWVKAGQSIPLS